MRDGHSVENEGLSELPLARLHQRLSLKLLCVNRLVATGFTIDFDGKSNAEKVKGEVIPLLFILI